MLTGKQKRNLRARANQLKVTVTIGKNGLNPDVLKFIDQDFLTKELVKIKVLKTCSVARDDILTQLSVLDNTEIVQTLGNTILLYRPLPEKESRLS
jgi:RNA-binding protein